LAHHLVIRSRPRRAVRTSPLGPGGYSAWRINSAGTVLLATSWVNRFPSGAAGGVGTGLVALAGDTSVVFSLLSFGGATAAYGINDAGQIVGGSYATLH
jgi:hypothetical protein